MSDTIDAILQTVRIQQESLRQLKEAVEILHEVVSQQEERIKKLENRPMRDPRLNRIG